MTLGPLGPPLSNWALGCLDTGSPHHTTTEYTSPLPSLSTPSLQFVSNLVEQSEPSHPSLHSQLQSPWKFERHCPLSLHWFGHPSIVQCLPFQPVTHKQVPFLHCPCSWHLGSHSLLWQCLPDQPSSQTHCMFSHCPCSPQSKLQSWTEQSFPVHPSSHLHDCVFISIRPWVEHPG